MHSFGRTDGTERRLAYGDEAAAAIRNDPATVHLVVALDKANTDLEKSWWDRLEAQRELRRTRAEVRVREAYLEQAHRGLLKVVKAEARGSGSALERELFPKGIEAVISPTGQEKVDLAIGVLKRLEKSEKEGAEVVRSVWKDRLDSEIEAFKKVLSAKSEALSRLRQARETEEELREEHARVLVVVGTQVRALFPRDRRRLRVFIPRNPRSRRRKGEQGMEDEELELLELEEQPRIALPPPRLSPPSADTDAA